MGVSNIYNQAKANAIAAIKSNLANSGVKKADSKPEYMKMTGSIFNAPNKTKDGKPVTTLASTNITASLADLNKKPIEATQSRGSNDNGSDMPGSASEGRAAASDVKAQGEKAEELRSKTEKQKKEVDNYNDNSTKLKKKTAQDNKKFKAQQLKLEAQVKADNKKLEKITNENDELQLQVNSAQNELNSLLAKNSFSMGGFGQSTTNAGDQAKITELQTLIGSKVGLMQSNGKIVYSLQRNQTRTITQMNKVNAQYIKVNNKNVKAMNQQQGETSKILNVATEVEKYSALVQTAGQTLNLLGQAMIAAGTTPWTAWMVPVGTVMAKVGTVAEMVGQYGVAAANVTKTAAYAAEGNIMGAMQSAAMAVQAGTAAYKSTTNLKSNFDSINTKANETLNKGAAKQAAKQQVEEMKQNGVDFKGMSEKDMRNSISNDLQAQMNGENPIRNRNDLLKDGKLTEAGRTATQESAATVQNNFQNNLNGVLPKGYTVDQAGIVKDASGNVVGNISDKDNKVIAKLTKQAGKKTTASFRNVASSSNPIKKSSTNWGDRMQQMNQGFMTLASIYGMSQNNRTSNKRHASQWDLNSDPRMARIMRSNESYRARRAYA